MYCGTLFREISHNWFHVKSRIKPFSRIFFNDFLPKKHSLQITVWNRLRQFWLLLFLEDFFVNSRNQNLGQQSTWSSLSFWSEQHKKIRSFSPPPAPFSPIWRFFSSTKWLISVDLGWTLMTCFWLFWPFFGEEMSSFVSLWSQKLL